MLFVAPPIETPPETLAAVDLGSNSFHLIVAKVAEGQLHIIDRLREMVRLGEGLTEDKQLVPEVQQRALDCLERFGQRLRPFPLGTVRAVGTNTLRQVSAKSSGFLHDAETALGHPIEVISGREEARLVYLGVAHSLAVGDTGRLVVDIGGGSTELIVGEGFSPKLRESLHMGCVSMSRRYFADGQITAESMDQAVLAGRLELRPVRRLFRETGWQNAIGSSGTIRAVESVLLAEGWTDAGITRSALKKLRKALVAAEKIDNISLKGLSPERKPVFPGGVAVLSAVFKALDIEEMQVSDKALREGVLYEMLGRIRHEDVRERTVDSLSRRYNIDSLHARRVESSVLAFYGQVSRAWELMHSEDASLLAWAARLHEIGLMVSHSQFQKHGAYLIKNSDLSGFSRQEQCLLASLILGHRRKFPDAVFDEVTTNATEALEAKRLCLLLRLAVLLHRGRSSVSNVSPLLEADQNHLKLIFPAGWLDDHPLTQLDLIDESQRLKQAGFLLDYQ